MTVRHRFVYSRNQPFRTPNGRGITVLERCYRGHGTELGAYECPAVRTTTYTEEQGRQSQQMEAADLHEWLK